MTRKEIEVYTLQAIADLEPTAWTPRVAEHISGTAGGVRVTVDQVHRAVESLLRQGSIRREAGAAGGGRGSNKRLYLFATNAGRVRLAGPHSAKQLAIEGATAAT